MIWALIFIPLAVSLMCAGIRRDTPRRILLLTASATHTTLVAISWVIQPQAVFFGWLDLDAPGRLFLSIASVLFLAASVYAVQYLRAETRGRREDFETGIFFVNAPEAIFTGCLLCFLATMTIACIGRHFGVIWVAMEATTLVSAPLIYFHRHQRSLEATWKYLLICSVGIALALLGNFFLSIAGSMVTGPISLGLSDLMLHAKQLNIPWVKAAFILFLVGYGTKMGLAPFHTWLPDAHSEAPSVVSALLSGALLNCAFLGILRSFQVCSAVGEANFARELLILFGLISMGLAAVFIIRQQDYKRMLAYSSVEHMGILSLGMGLGGSAVFGSILHTINHSLTKSALFFIAGNILTLYRTKIVSDVRGLIHLSPISGIAWLAGIFAITGFPPFGVFISEFIIAREGFAQGSNMITSLYLIFLTVIFVGIIGIAIQMAQGRADDVTNRHTSGHFWAVIPPLFLIIIVFLLGLYIPEPVNQAVQEVARTLGGN